MHHPGYMTMPLGDLEWTVIFRVEFLELRDDFSQEEFVLGATTVSGIFVKLEDVNDL